MRLQLIYFLNGRGKVLIGVCLRGWLWFGLLCLRLCLLSHHFFFFLIQSNISLDLVVQFFSYQFLNFLIFLSFLHQQLQQIFFLVMIQLPTLTDGLYLLVLLPGLFLQLHASEVPLEQSLLVERIDNMIIGIQSHVPLLQLVLRVKLEEDAGQRMHRCRFLQELLETQDYHCGPAILGALEALEAELLHCSLLPPQEHYLIQLQFDVIGRVLQSVVVFGGQSQSPHESLGRIRYLEALVHSVLAGCFQFPLVFLQLAYFSPQLGYLLLQGHILLPQQHHFLLALAILLPLGEERPKGRVRLQVVRWVGDGRAVGLRGVELSRVGEEFPDVGEIERGVLGPVLELFGECPQGVEPFAGDIRGRHSLTIFYYCNQMLSLQNIHPPTNSSIAHQI